MTVENTEGINNEYNKKITNPKFDVSNYDEINTTEKDILIWLMGRHKMNAEPSYNGRIIDKPIDIRRLYYLEEIGSSEFWKIMKAFGKYYKRTVESILSKKGEGEGDVIETDEQRAEATIENGYYWQKEVLVQALFPDWTDPSTVSHQELKDQISQQPEKKQKRLRKLFDELNNEDKKNQELSKSHKLFEAHGYPQIFKDTIDNYQKKYPQYDWYQWALDTIEFTTQRNFYRKNIDKSMSSSDSPISTIQEHIKILDNTPGSSPSWYDINLFDSEWYKQMPCASDIHEAPRVIFAQLMSLEWYYIDDYNADSKKWWKVYVDPATNTKKQTMHDFGKLTQLKVQIWLKNEETAKMRLVFKWKK